MGKESVQERDGANKTSYDTFALGAISIRFRLNCTTLAYRRGLNGANKHRGVS